MKKIECIIMDWAGTAVDYGCFAPVAAFMESFNVIGTPVTAAETRAHMGLTKVEEIRALFNIDRVRNEIQEKYGFRTTAIVTMKEVVEHLYNKEYKGKVIIDDTLKAAIDAYYEQYGVK